MGRVVSGGARLLPQRLGERKIAGSRVYAFEPGQTAHAEASHVHDTEEVFLKER